jgi:diguanylate cyclase (GGDEF)-like protein
MVLFGTRAPWLIGLMVAVLALPIIGITAYLTYGVQQLIDRTQSERAAVAQLDALDGYFTDALAYSRAATCPQLGTNLSALRARADASFASVDALQNANASAPPDWSGVRAAWRAARRPAHARADFDALFESLTATFASAADRSGLTYDSDFAGISLADALSYRLPEAIANLHAARRRLCTSRGIPPLLERLALKKHQALADKSIGDALQDASDAIHLGGKSTLDLAAIERAYRDSLHDTARASAELDAYMIAPVPTNQPRTERALDAAIAALHALMRAEIPTLEAKFSLRLADYRRQRLIRIVPGIVGLIAALLVAMLMIRLVFEHAALQVAKQTANEQERMALHDGLTGIMNRRAFFSTLERAVTGGTNRGALCVFDIDHFKRINDTYGHMAGDEMLVRLAQTIEASVRSTDAVARLGGDEFAAFLHPPIDRRGVERALEKITHDMKVPVEIRGQTIQSSVSVGAALIRGESMREIQEALARADAALYKAKAEARGSFFFSEEE